MCLAVPGIVKSISGREAEVEIGGVSYKSNIWLTPDVKVGDYVLLHTGYTISVLDKEEALETLRLLKEISEIEDR
jgi:hydrogenase expression/formation protein HypC